MTSGGRALLIALASAHVIACAVDDRKLTVAGACLPAPPNGLLTDFSVSRTVTCPAGICPPELVGAGSVTLGTRAEVEGEIFPYAAPGLSAVVIGLALGDAPTERSLRVAVDTGAPRTDAAADAFDGVAMQFFTCLDVSAYAAISFTVGGTLGLCPLDVAAQFKDADGGTFPHTPCPLSDCYATERTTVTVGTTTLPFVSAATQLGGLQWEFTALAPPTHDRCAADVTIDDVRLIPR